MILSQIAFQNEIVNGYFNADCNYPKGILGFLFNITGINTYASTCNEFDISILYTLLRNNEGIQAPINNWDKDIDPKSENEGDDVERIRYYRNKLFHCSPLTKETDEYNEEWLIIAKV